MLSILTINVHKGFGMWSRRPILDELRIAIRRVGSEIVFLQEVRGTQRRAKRRQSTYTGAPQYEFLADSIWPHFSYGRNAAYPAGDHGNALLSKFPIVSHANFDVSESGDEPRGLLHAVLDLGGLGTLHAICVHLGLSERHRLRQLHLLCEVIEREVPAMLPLIVAGDFNDWWGRAHRPLSACAGLVEVFASAHGCAARTFPARWPVLRLDRIYVRNARHRNR